MRHQRAVSKKIPMTSSGWPTGLRQGGGLTGRFARTAWRSSSSSTGSLPWNPTATAGQRRPFERGASRLAWTNGTALCTMAPRRFGSSYTGSTSRHRQRPPTTETTPIWRSSPSTTRESTETTGTSHGGTGLPPRSTAWNKTRNTPISSSQSVCVTTTSLWRKTGQTLAPWTARTTTFSAWAQTTRVSTSSRPRMTPTTSCREHHTHLARIGTAVRPELPYLSSGGRACRPATHARLAERVPDARAPASCTARGNEDVGTMPIYLYMYCM